MKAVKRFLAIAISLAVSACAQLSPYAGEEGRGIKSLSSGEVEGYLHGNGMGFAKAAELNGYPGPMHVLELADELKLQPLQREATRRLMQDHKAEARELGRRFVETEAELNRLFASRNATPESLALALRKSGELQTRIRESHLATHLKQTALLTPEQIADYSRLRGYTGKHSSNTHVH
jgi:Spy/CpxP family protein refolding chaperone